MSSWNDPFLTRLFLETTPLIDVRAPIEFKAGAVPNSVNLPIMLDEERAQVGTCYRQHGQAAAIALGHQLVSSEVKEARVKAWAQYLSAHPNGRVFCFRGGLRSQISCQWLRESGIEQWPLEGGYKRLRRYLISWLEEAPLPVIYRLGGLTGTGKTPFLKGLPNHLDIEGRASHRGSAFGGHTVQPAQITFENLLAFDLLKQREQKWLLVEDESATLGSLSIPRRLFQTMRASRLVVLKVDLEQRIKNIFSDYVKDSNEDFFLAGLERIKKRLSSKSYRDLKEEVQRAFASTPTPENHAKWITVLLEQYYDPLYQKDLNRNKHLVAFEGSESEVLEFLASLTD